MDFHTLLRRDLQFLCKRNKIPANMTNVAMADALKALETVEGLDEFMNGSDSNAPQSPSTVAKQPPKTAARTTRRTATTKAEPKPSSKLVTGSCQLKSKALAGEMEQESKTNKVAKTPAVRTTRKTSAATSCIIKVQESNSQSVYNTRRSTRLLGKAMAGLSLETKETLDKQEKSEDTEQKVSEQEINPAASSEDEVIIQSRDLCASMEKEWEKLKNGSDDEVEVMADENTGSINETDQVMADENTGSNNDTDDVMADEKETMNSLVQEDKQKATSEATRAMCEEVPEKNGNDQKRTGDLVDNPVLDAETNDDQIVAEPKNVLTLEQADQQKTEEPYQENDEDKTMDQTGIDAGVDADGTVSKADSSQAVLGSDIAEEKMIVFETEEAEVMADEKESMNSLVQEDKEEASLDANNTLCEEGPEMNDNDQEVTGDLALNFANTETSNDQKEPKNVLALEEADEQKTEEPIQENDEDTTMDQTGVDADGSVSEADSNQAVMGSDIADEEMIGSESEGSLSFNLEESEVKTTALSPLATESSFAAEAISVQFPRPNKSTNPSKNSALKVVNVENKDKENNMEMMMMVNVDQGVAKKKKKKVEIDEESLKGSSIRQLTKMVKALSIKSSSSNRTALQILPGNDQKAE